MKLGEIAQMLEGRLRGNAEKEIKGVAGLEEAAEGDISFAAGRKYLVAASESKASCILVKEFVSSLDKQQLEVRDPQYAFALLLGRFYPREHGPAGISPLAYVDEGASLDEDVAVMPFAAVSAGASIGRRTVLYPGVYVGRGVSVGVDCVLYPNVTLMDGTTLGDRVAVHAGSVLGSDGFGYLQREGKNVKIPQVGGVVVGDDVEIGSCVTIDRATTGNTVVGRGTKIDNLVQIAHNVNIGQNCVIVAQVGIAGSSRLGENVVMGGQAAAADHSVLENGTVLGARAGVFGNVSRGVYSGAPAIPHRDWLRSSSLFAKLPEMSKKIAELERKLDELQGGPDR